MRKLLGLTAIAGIAYLLLKTGKDDKLIKLPKDFFKVVDGEPHFDIEATIMSLFTDLPKK